MSQLTLTVLLILLLVSPGVLMLASHIYGVRSQDKFHGYTVIFHDDVVAADVIAEHGGRRGVRIERVFDSRVPGYSAMISTHAVEKIKKDARVKLIDRQESDEFNVRTAKLERRSALRFGRRVTK